jgi:hypothetical protein
MTPIVAILLLVVIIMYSQVILFMLTLIKNSKKTYLLMITMGETGKVILAETFVLLLSITSICYLYAIIVVSILTVYLEKFFLYTLGSNIKVNLNNVYLHLSLIVILIIIDIFFIYYNKKYIRKLNVREV